MKRKWLYGGLGLLSLALVQVAHAAIVSTAGNTVEFNNSLLLTDPKGWDFQMKKGSENPQVPFQWVKHWAGQNPMIRLKYQTVGTGLTGKTTLDYAGAVKYRYQKDGIRITRMDTHFVNGRPVAVLHGKNPVSNVNFLIGVYKKGGKGYILECSAQKKHFAELLPEFQGMINTARLIK